MQQVRCPTCDITFGVSVSFHKGKVDTGEEFFCPAGHSMHFRPTKAELELKVVGLEVRLAEWEEYAGRLSEFLATERERATKALLSAAGYKSQWMRVRGEKKMWQDRYWALKRGEG